MARQREDRRRLQSGPAAATGENLDVGGGRSGARAAGTAAAALRDGGDLREDSPLSSLPRNP